MKLTEMLKPVWTGGKIYREACTFIEENGVCQARLLYTPVAGSIHAVSYDGSTDYEEGTDYILSGDTVTLTVCSRIPHGKPDDLILKDKAAADAELAAMGEDLGFGPVATSDGHYITLSAINHPEYITRFTVLFSYDTLEKGLDIRQESCLNRFPKLSAKLKSGQDCHFVLYGDSISYGCDCSGLYHLAPHQPVWAELVQKWLEQVFHNHIRLNNISKPSADTVWATEHCKERMNPDWKPDLVILGYGMNDRCHGGEYAKRTAALIQEVREIYPGVEILLIATTLPNKLVPTPPIYFYAHQDEFPAVLYDLQDTEIAVADVQKIQTALMEKKRYIDLTGNFLNHPNDYLARVQAQTVAAALM